MDGVYSALRALATLRPIEGTKTGLHYQLKKNRRLVARQGRRYLEAENWEIASKCKEYSMLKVCQWAFAGTSNPETTCLSSLFAGMEANVIEQWQANIGALPLQPVALFLGFSNYLVETPNSQM